MNKTNRLIENRLTAVRGEGPWEGWVKKVTLSKNPKNKITVGNRSKHGKCGSAPTQKSQWGARLAGRTCVHG